MRYVLALSVLLVVGSLGGSWLTEADTSSPSSNGAAPEPEGGRAGRSGSSVSGELFDLASEREATAGMASDFGRPAGVETTTDSLDELSADLPFESGEGKEPLLATLAGQVHFDGGAVEGASLFLVPRGRSAVDGEEGLLLEFVDLDDDGAFAGEFEAGDYRLVARANGFLPTVVEGLTLSPGEEVRGIDVELAPGLSVSARVTIEGESSSDVQTELEGQGFRRISQTEEDGKVHFDGLPPGEYLLRAFRAGEGSAEALVSAGGEEATLALAQPGQLLVEVAYENGLPAVGVHVLVVEALLGVAENVDPHGTESGLEAAADPARHTGCSGAHCVRGVTDQEGKLLVKVTRGAELVVAAEGHPPSAMPQRGWVKSKEGARSAFVRLVRAEPLSLRVLSGERTPPGTLSFVPASGDFMFAVEKAAVGPGGGVTFNPWPNVSGSVRIPPGQTLEGRLPDGFEVDDRPQRRGCGMQIIIESESDPGLQKRQPEGAGGGF